MTAVATFIGLIESLEDARQFVFGNADTFIGYGNEGSLSLAFGADGNGIVRCLTKLYRIVEEVDEYIFQ